MTEDCRGVNNQADASGKGRCGCSHFEAFVKLCVAAVALLLDRAAPVSFAWADSVAAYWGRGLHFKSRLVSCCQAKESRFAVGIAMALSDVWKCGKV